MTATDNNRPAASGGTTDFGYQEVPVAEKAARVRAVFESVAGNYDLMAKFYVDDDVDVGHFVNEKVQVISGIKDTFTTVTFRAF